MKLLQEHILRFHYDLLQAGTQFWDEKLQNELSEGRLSGSAFDRLVVLKFSQRDSL